MPTHNVSSMADALDQLMRMINELLGHAYIGVTATVYAHVRIRLQRNAIDLLSHALGSP